MPILKNGPTCSDSRNKCVQDSFSPIAPKVSLKTKNLGSRKGEPDFEEWGFGLRMRGSGEREGVLGRGSVGLGRHWVISGFK